MNVRIARSPLHQAFFRIAVAHASAPVRCAPDIARSRSRTGTREHLGTGLERKGSRAARTVAGDRRNSGSGWPLLEVAQQGDHVVGGQRICDPLTAARPG